MHTAMNKMQNDSPKPEKSKRTQTEEEIEVERSEANSIQNFIERKKLQNRILQKMIEKLNQSESPKNTKTN